MSQYIAELRRELRDLDAAHKWGIEHPYAGYCGEDDAREDRMEAIRAELSVLCQPR